MRKGKILVLCTVLAIIAILLLMFPYIFPGSRSYGFARAVSSQEEANRLLLVDTACQWLGCRESNGTHKSIIDLYNAHEPLARDYAVKYTDQWCAAFGSAAAIACKMTDIIPTECGCEKQIILFQTLGRFEEDDSYLPLPGDYIFFSSKDSGEGDCTEWSDHVGIVVGTSGSYIKVIEGNNNGAVRYRYMKADSKSIRGYGIPDYASIVTEKPQGK